MLRNWQPSPRIAGRTAAALALATRFCERVADQAVSVAKRLDFAKTGALPDSDR